MEGLLRDVQQRARILAHRIEHHGIAEFADDLAHNVDRLGLEPTRSNILVTPGHLPNSRTSTLFTWDSADESPIRVIISTFPACPIRPTRGAGFLLCLRRRRRTSIPPVTSLSRNRLSVGQSVVQLHRAIVINCVDPRDESPKAFVKIIQPDLSNEFRC